jgi:protein-tyrosine phosphatase
MPSVLFICTGNQFRSPIAEETFRQLLKEDGRKGWDVSSAGTWTAPGQPPFRETVELARSLGLDLSGHLTRLVDESMLASADVVLVMESGHKESLEIEFPKEKKKVFLLAEVVKDMKYDIPDPAMALDDAETILRNVASLIREGREKIYRLAESHHP